MMENKHCPRCNAAFECKADDILNCQCTGLVFAEPQKEAIVKEFNGCLCRKCLLELKHETVKPLGN